MVKATNSGLTRALAMVRPHLGSLLPRVGALGPSGLWVHGQEEGPELEKEAETPRNHLGLWEECITERGGETELEH